MERARQSPETLTALCAAISDQWEWCVDRSFWSLNGNLAKCPMQEGLSAIFKWSGEPAAEARHCIHD